MNDKKRNLINKLFDINTLNDYNTINNRNTENNRNTITNNNNEYHYTYNSLLQDDNLNTFYYNDDSFTKSIDFCKEMYNNYEQKLNIIERVDYNKDKNKDYDRLINGNIIERVDYNKDKDYDRLINGNIMERVDYNKDKDKDYDRLINGNIISDVSNGNIISKFPYKPKSTKYKGKDREGECPVCGCWYKLRTSSYWYHMNYKHGINSNNNKIKDPLIRINNYNGNNNNYNNGNIEGLDLMEGFCTICNKWVILNSKNKKCLFSWYKHFQKNHGNKKYQKV